MGARALHNIPIHTIYTPAAVWEQRRAWGVKMSSYSAAAISAMIITQVNPRLYFPPPPPRTVTRQQREEQESEVSAIFSDGTDETIWSFQIILGFGILVTFLITFLLNGMSLPSIVISLTSSLVYITNGVLSCFRMRCQAGVKHRLVLIRVSVITNAIGVVAALISIVIYSVHFKPWSQHYCHGPHYCRYDLLPTPTFIILLLLTILELGFAILTTVYGWSHLRHVDDLTHGSQQL
ncbi:hypothetical protein SKAU_G00408110 [Synaphobranchus kaupii]|uniref:Uncharacterized protein n=1 Tax=Synaphobranchus kaupii TaxID=118154 RepID=A0A9Q1EAE2_SYNKA|nr:hypothetical protein SKAU_G00408110 [Synaphobranchus kaupii]